MLAVPQIEPEKLLQSMALLLQEGQDKVTFQVQEGERGKGDDMCFSLVVREVVTATRVPVLKLFDSDSNLEVPVLLCPHISIYILIILHQRIVRYLCLSA